MLLLFLNVMGLFGEKINRNSMANFLTHITFLQLLKPDLCLILQILKNQTML